MNKIVPSIWLNEQTQEAVDFYTTVFRDGRLIETSYYLTETPSNKPVGSILEQVFEIEDQTFSLINGGDFFRPNPSISFFVNRDSVQEVQDLWGTLKEGGKVLMELGEYPWSKQYGWIQDRFGVSWQVTCPSSEGDMRPRIVPSFLFVNENYGKAQEALEYYLSVFDDTRIGKEVTYPEDEGPNKKGALMYGDIRIGNQWFSAMDGGGKHDFQFSEGLSLIVFCRDQEEIDYLHEKLSAVPESNICGWVKDQFGISWQLVPQELSELLNGEDTEKGKRVMEALMKMGKIDIQALRDV